MSEFYEAFYKKLLEPPAPDAFGLHTCEPTEQNLYLDGMLTFVHAPEYTWRNAEYDGTICWLSWWDGERCVRICRIAPVAANGYHLTIVPGGSSFASDVWRDVPIPARLR